MPPLSYVRELPAALRHFAVVDIPVLVTNDYNRAAREVHRGARRHRVEIPLLARPD